MLQYLEKLKHEDMDTLIKKRDNQKAILKDVARANDVSTSVVMVVNGFTFNNSGVIPL